MLVRHETEQVDQVLVILYALLGAKYADRDGVAWPSRRTLAADRRTRHVRLVGQRAGWPHARFLPVDGRAVLHHHRPARPPGEVERRGQVAARGPPPRVEHPDEARPRGRARVRRSASLDLMGRFVAADDDVVKGNWSPLLKASEALGEACSGGSPLTPSIARCAR